MPPQSGRAADMNYAEMRIAWKAPYALLCPAADLQADEADFLLSPDFDCRHYPPTARPKRGSSAATCSIPQQKQLSILLASHMPKPPASVAFGGDTSREQPPPAQTRPAGGCEAAVLPAPRAMLSPRASARPLSRSAPEELR